MVTPSLRLAIIKGPREGDTLDYKPGSTIRIGRIVRGNEIAIKDTGISTKHLRIAESVSGNWAIQDLGSSNGTVLNSTALDSETPVDLRDGDVIKLGEYTSVVVNFVIDDNDVQEEQKKKLPPRPRRNNKRQGNSGKRIRVRVSESNDFGDVSDEEKGFDVGNVNKPSSRVRKVRKIENSEKSGFSDGLEEVEDSIKVEIEDCAMGEEVLGSVVKKRVNSEAARSKSIGIVEKEETLKEKRNTRATRSKKIDIVGDSYLELEMVLKRARKSCEKKKKKTAEQKSFEGEEDTDAGLQGLSCPVEEDLKNERGTVVEVDLGKMTLGALFSFLEGHLSNQINQETESMIEPMRSKNQRVREFISEQRQVQAKACMCSIGKVCSCYVAHRASLHGIRNT
ncbi:PREDICTED: FHA domain-containing protein At4g14490-like [Camelina sativa]|uniref:FHA domain-containing protein At4g14490-like n=1 Tax=Camelina sativa TaxID=90675 RepID=A0ABM0UFN3_CAMSA|nr:PREDICTED: FHA domain-containing protein At4g14490-like [Camelina sativa]